MKNRNFGLSFLLAPPPSRSLFLVIRFSTPSSLVVSRWLDERKKKFHVNALPSRCPFGNMTTTTTTTTTTSFFFHSRTFFHRRCDLSSRGTLEKSSGLSEKIEPSDPRSLRLPVPILMIPVKKSYGTVRRVSACTINLRNLGESLHSDDNQ